MPRGQYDRKAAGAKRDEIYQTMHQNLGKELAGETIAPVVAKPTRADEVRQERRRKPGSAQAVGIKLAVDESKVDRSTYHYRFARSTGGRIQSLTANDYDIAPEGAKSDGNSLGTVNSVHGGVDDAGKPYDLVLMRKRKDWFEADQKEKMKPLDEMDEAIRRNNPNHKGNDLRGTPGVYVPGDNTIERA